MLIEAWDRATPRRPGARRSAAIKDSGAPLGAQARVRRGRPRREGDDGTPVIPVDAHIRLAAPPRTTARRILRRGYSFTDGIDARPGQLDAGLFFIGFQRDPARSSSRCSSSSAAATRSTSTSRTTAARSSPSRPARSPAGSWARASSRSLSRSGTHLSTSCFSPATTCARSRLSDADVLAAVEAAVRAQGEGAVTLDPRVHHVPDPAFPGHFNLLRATVWPLGVDRREGRRRLRREPHRRPAVGARARDPLRPAHGRARSRSSTGRRSPSGAPARSRRSGPRAGSARFARARASRRPRHRLLERDDARRAVRLRRDPGDEQAGRFAAGLRRAGSRRRSGSRSA